MRDIKFVISDMIARALYHVLTLVLYHENLLDSKSYPRESNGVFIRSNGCNILAICNIVIRCDILFK